MWSGPHCVAPARANASRATAAPSAPAASTRNPRVGESVSTPVGRAPVSKGKQVDKSKVTCFKCGGMGHYSTESVCPRFGEASLHRMEAESVAQDKAEEDDGANPEPPTNDPDIAGEDDNLHGEG